MADMVCSKCNVGWQILEHDRFCGYCGCEVFNFSVKWQDEPLFYIGDLPDNRELTILVENAGATPITFHPIQIHSGEALTLPDTDKPFTVKPGKIYTIEVHVDPDKLTTQQPEKVIVCAQDVSPNKEGRKSLELQTLPLPEFTLKPSRLTLSYPKSKETETVVFNIEFQGNPFHIEGIDSSQEWINSVDLSKAPESFRLEINCNQLEKGLNSKTLRIKLRDPSQPIEKQIQIQTEILKEPPKLFVPEENLEIIQDKKRSHTLKLKNTGEDPLTINNIALDESSCLVQLPNLEFPIIIEGEKYRDVEISVSSVDIPPKTHPVKFTIISDCATAPEYQYTLNVTVKERKKYTHYLAIDFGTTNSCCAYIDEQYNLKPIPLEDRDTDDSVNPTLSDIMIMASSIIYRSQPEDGKDYDVGYKAETDRTDSKDGPYYISSVKRWLGFGWRRQFPNNQQLQPVDVVSHILKHIINKAEDYLEQQQIASKITRCVVTYPTKFNPQQKDALKQAFENIGITDLILIDEASAASMGIIFENYENLPEDYRLLVYDFGGGTIDIVLSQVTKKGNDITIEPIARDGDPKYGGDHVTQAIVDYVISEYRRRIEEISPGHNFDIPYYGPGQILQESGDTKNDDATRNNSVTLYRRAEEMKKELGTPSETELSSPSETELSSQLDVVEGTVMPFTNFVQKILRDREHIQDETDLMERTQEIVRVILSAQEFQRFIKPALNKTFDAIDTMIADNGERLPDLIVLAGQSSKMRFVKQMMAARFKNKYQKDIEIRLDEHPKTCVVMGAAEYGRIFTVPHEEDGAVNIISLSNKTHTRIGITRVRRGVGRVFSEIIPKGKLIPAKSFNTIKFPLRSRITSIDVYEHFGSGDEVDDNQVSRIDNYVLDLKKDVPDETLREAELEMAIELNGEIKLTAIVGDDKHPFTVKREKPEFVDEIPRTTPIRNTVKPQTISPYQREAEEAIRDAQQRLMELEHNYRDGEPIDLDNVFTSTPSQKVLLNLNTIARDLCQWTSELKQAGQTDLLQTLTYAEKAIKDKLKTIRGEVIPSPKTLDPPTDVSTDTEVNRIRNKCDNYVVKFEGTLRSYELEREVNTSICEQFIKNKLFNNLARFMPSDALSKKLDKFLQLVDLEIVPIKIGETQADSRVHHIQESKQTGVERGRIAEVIQPGLMQKTDGAIVQKPVVIRGE